MIIQALRPIFSLVLAFCVVSSASAQTTNKLLNENQKSFSSVFDTLVKGGTWKYSDGAIARFSWEAPGAIFVEEMVGDGIYTVSKYTLQPNESTVSYSDSGIGYFGKNHALKTDMGKGFFDSDTGKIHIERILVDTIRAAQKIAEIKRNVAPSAKFQNPETGGETAGYTLEILPRPDGSHSLEYAYTDGRKTLRTLKPTPAAQFEKAVTNFTPTYERIVTASERRASRRNSDPGFWSTLLGAVVTGAVTYEASKSASEGGYQPARTFTPQASTYSSPPAASAPSASTPSSGYSGSVNRRPEVPGVPNCLRIEAGPKGQLGGSQRIVNTCPYEVEAAWSEPGAERLSNRWSLGIGGSYTVKAGLITYNACRGKNTIVKSEGKRIWCFAH